jgi:hypothetical protein
MALENDVELLAMEDLPSDPIQRLEHLRALVHAEHYPYPLCPECGEEVSGLDPVKHAQTHYPLYIPASRFSAEARAREAVLYKMAGQTPPTRY